LIQPILNSTVSDIEARGLPARQFFNRTIELADKYS